MIAQSDLSGLDVLNCNLGDLKLSFDPTKPIEADRASRAVTDMLRRGYVIFVEVDGKLQRVKQFDAERSEYIITDAPGKTANDDDKQTSQDQVETETAGGEEAAIEPEGKAPLPIRVRKEKSTKRISAAKTKATAIAPRAGG